MPTQRNRRQHDHHLDGAVARTPQPVSSSASHNASPSRRRIPALRGDAGDGADGVGTSSASRKSYSESSPQQRGGGGAAASSASSARAASEQTWVDMLRRTSPSNSPDKPDVPAAADDELPRTQPRSHQHQRRRIANPVDGPAFPAAGDVSPSPRPVPPPPAHDFHGYHLGGGYGAHSGGFLGTVGGFADASAPPGGYFIAGDPAHVSRRNHQRGSYPSPVMAPLPYYHHHHQHQQQQPSYTPVDSYSGGGAPYNTSHRYNCHGYNGDTTLSTIRGSSTTNPSTAGADGRGASPPLSNHHFEASSYQQQPYPGIARDDVAGVAETPLDADMHSVVSSAPLTPRRDASPAPELGDPGSSHAYQPVYGPTAGRAINHARAALAAAAAAAESQTNQLRSRGRRWDPYDSVSPVPFAVASPSPNDAGSSDVDVEGHPSYHAQLYDTIMRAEQRRRFTPYGGGGGVGFGRVELWGGCPVFPPPDHRQPEAAAGGHWRWCANEPAAGAAEPPYAHPHAAPPASFSTAVSNNSSTVFSDGGGGGGEASRKKTTPGQLPRGHAPRNTRPRTPPTPTLPLGAGVAEELVESSRRSPDEAEADDGDHGLVSRNRRLRGRGGRGAWGQPQPHSPLAPAAVLSTPPPPPSATAAAAAAAASPRRADEHNNNSDDGPPTPTRKTTQPAAPPSDETDPNLPPPHAYTLRASLAQLIRGRPKGKARHVFIDPQYTGDHAAVATSLATVRLGGIQGDICPRSLAAAIETVSGVRPIGVGVFRPVIGIAVLWLRDPAHEAPIVTAKFHQRAWMSTCAMYLPGSEEQCAALEKFAADLPQGCRVPRRLMTCEPWEERGVHEAKAKQKTNGT